MLPGQALLRVRGRAMDLRVILDKSAAGNTGLIIAFYFVHLSYIYSSHICRTGAIKGAWEGDAFACDFGQKCRRQYLSYYRECSLGHRIIESFLLITSRSHIYHTYAGHMSIRVHRRTRDLRVILDKGAAGNTCRIIESVLLVTALSRAFS